MSEILSLPLLVVVASPLMMFMVGDLLSDNRAMRTRSHAALGPPQERISGPEIGVMGLEDAHKADFEKWEAGW